MSFHLLYARILCEETPPSPKGRTKGTKWGNKIAKNGQDILQSTPDKQHHYCQVEIVEARLRHCTTSDTTNVMLVIRCCSDIVAMPTIFWAPLHDTVLLKLENNKTSQNKGAKKTKRPVEKLICMKKPPRAPEGGPRGPKGQQNSKNNWTRYPSKYSRQASPLPSGWNRWSTPKTLHHKQHHKRDVSC